MSTDSRDRIYSILSLLPQAELSNTLLQPDYSLSMAEVYTRAAFYILETLQNLDLFSYITRPYDNPFTDNTWDAALPVIMPPYLTAQTDEYDFLKYLPSWVPTWDDNDTTMQSMLFNACGHFSTYSILFEFLSTFEPSLSKESWLTESGLLTADRKVSSSDTSCIRTSSRGTMYFEIHVLALHYKQGIPLSEGGAKEVRRRLEDSSLRLQDTV